MTKTTMRFLFGDRELVLTAGDLLAAPVTVIVSPDESDLSGTGDLARRIRLEAGTQLTRECEQLIREYAQIDHGMAVFTTAGDLPFTAVIHAVGPDRSDDDQQRVLEQAVSRSLQLCELNEWQSIAFPDFLDEKDPDTTIIYARAFYRAITRFWDARYESLMEKVIIYAHPDRFRAFFDAFRNEGIGSDSDQELTHVDKNEETVGHVTLSESDVDALDDVDIDDWFK